MPENTNVENAPKEDGTGTFTPPATQDELNAIIKDRLERERKKYADYSDLKAKAARLDEIEEANASEVEKAAKRAEKAEKELAELKRQSTLRNIADEFGIAKDDLDFIEAPDEETIRAKAERFAARVKAEKEQEKEQEKPDDRKVGFHLDTSSRQDQPDKTSRDEAARAFFGV